MPEEDIHDVDRKAEEAITTTDTLANNEDVQHPPVKSLSKFMKISYKIIVKYVSLSLCFGHF